MKVVFTPFSIVLGLAAGIVGRKIFEQVWGLIDKDEPPHPQHRETGGFVKLVGALGGVIVFLTWLWITNNVILLGAEVNAEVERGRQIQGGLQPKDKEPFLEPRDTRKMKDHD